VAAPDPCDGLSETQPMLRLRCEHCGHVTLYRIDAAGHTLERPVPQPPELAAADHPPAQVPAGTAGTAKPLALRGPPEIAAAASVAAPMEPAVQGSGARARRARPPWITPARLLQPFEMWYAWRASRRLLALYHRVRAEQPATTGVTLYELIVSRFTGKDPQAARTVLRRAEQSFIDWRDDRDLLYRDVVLYVVADAYMRLHPGRHGAHASMANIVTRVIPGYL
jgi:hypothetical protein